MIQKGCVLSLLKSCALTHLMTQVLKTAQREQKQAMDHAREEVKKQVNDECHTTMNKIKRAILGPVPDITDVKQLIPSSGRLKFCLLSRLIHRGHILLVCDTLMDHSNRSSYKLHKPDLGSIWLIYACCAFFFLTGFICSRLDKMISSLGARS